LRSESFIGFLNPVDIVPNAAAADLFLTVDALIAERAKFPKLRQSLSIEH
jgi:hypothetical protein